MHTLGRLLLIILSSLALALNAVMIGLGWMRILFHTGWANQNISYPVVILFLILVFGFANSRMRSTGKSASVMTISTLMALFCLTGFTMLDIAYQHALTTPLLDLFNMRTVIVEEEWLNITAVSGAVVYPILWLLWIFPSMAVVRRLFK